MFSDLPFPDVNLTTLVWYLAHGVLFFWFSAFLAPLRNSDRANMAYFWTVSFLSLMLLITSICHAPRLFHSHSTTLLDVLAFSWTIAPVVAFILEVCSKFSRIALGYTLTSPLLSLLSNSLLVTIALSIQYMTCIENGYYRPGIMGSGSLLDVPYMHCWMLESPAFIPVPVILTILILLFISYIVGLVFGPSVRFFQYRHRRHGYGLFERPEDDPKPVPVQTEMVPWFSLSLTATALELLLSVKVFVGRLDIRHILIAVCKDDSDVIFDVRSVANSSWVDFFADGGDGFNSSYCIARLMAQPNIQVRVSDEMRDKSSVFAQSNSWSSFTVAGMPQSDSALDLPTLAETTSSPSLSSFVVRRGSTHPVSPETDDRISPSRCDGILSLPRAGVVVHGGDLAYPRPSSETYRTRFVEPLLAAFPVGPPSAAALKNKARMFIIPGNHDHYDGLETFVKWIIGKDSLGGWLLPQKSSFFALQLSRGWWVLAMDVGLTNDVDVFQFQTFRRIVETRIGAEDRVVVLTHRPQWVMDPYNSVVTGELFHQLLDLIGSPRLAMRLAGDLHHYTRYSGGHTLPPLVTSGGAGAFLHPTHVPGDDTVHAYFKALRKQTKPDCTAANSDDSSEDDAVTAGENKKGRWRKWMSRKQGWYNYRKSGCFPSESTSRKLAWMNLLGFRDKNWGADIIFGTMYCCMGVSVLPLCNAGNVVSVLADTYQRHSLLPAILVTLHQLVVGMIVPAFRSILLDSVFSLGAHAMFLFCCYSGATWHKNNPIGRLGVALCHYAAHALACVTIFCLIELGIEFLSHMTSGRESIVADGFRVPGLLLQVDKHVFDYPVLESVLTQILRFIDFPSSIIRNRAPICRIPSLVVGREQLFRYIWRIIPFVWVLATPVAALIMGAYLLVNINYLGLHLNEAFSSLRIEDYKNFLRFFIDETTGDLHVYVIGVDHVPKQWEEDPSWDPRLFTNHPGMNPVLPPSFKWVTPSRWRPVGQWSEPALVDYFVVPRLSSAAPPATPTIQPVDLQSNGTRRRTKQSGSE